MTVNENQDTDQAVSDRLRRRSVTVKVHLSPLLYKRLDDIAERRGFPLVSLMALIAGEYAEKVESDLQIRRIVALEVARRGSSVISDPVSERRPL